MKPSLRSFSPLFLTALASTLLPFGMTGCATKSARVVNAGPLVIPQRNSPTDWAVTSAPRTRPGTVMDPDAVTYAQVPSRILFLPGQHGLFGRSSAQQETAYDLVPVDRIKEIQARETPGYEGRPEYAGQKSKNKVPASFNDSDGNLRKGNARRLGVTGKDTAEKNRAEAFLTKDETLEWMPELGWVGFTETEYVRINTPTIKAPPLPDLEADPKLQAPVLEAPGLPERIRPTEKKPEKAPEIPENKDRKNKPVELDFGS